MEIADVLKTLHGRGIIHGSLQISDVLIGLDDEVLLWNLGWSTYKDDPGSPDHIYER